MKDLGERLREGADPSKHAQVFAYLEVERLLGRPDAVYRWFDPWLPLALILCSSVITLALQWIISRFDSEDSDHSTTYRC